MSLDFLTLSEESKKPQITQFAWMHDCNMELVTTIDRFKEVVDEMIEAKHYALDLETTGLDNRVFDGRTVDQIVGVCMSGDGVTGYYVPVRHLEGDVNIAVHDFEREMRRLAAADTVAIFHRGKFDHEFLQFCGGDPMGEWDDPTAWEDTLILGYLTDSRQKVLGLKHLSKTLLDMEMIELKQLFGSDHKGKMNFAMLDPTWDACLWYAASDAICTYRLWKHLYDGVVNPEDGGPSQATVYQIEKMCGSATRWMERCRVHVDQVKVAELTILGQQELFDSIKGIYDFCANELGRDIAPAWWRVFAEGVRYDDDQGKENQAAVFDAQDIDHHLKMQLDEAKKIVTHNKKLPPHAQSRELLIITEHETARVKKTITVKRRDEEREFPYQYDVMSATQLGNLFLEMGVPGLRFTEKSGQVMTTKGEMDRLTEKYGDEFPFMAKIKRFREVQKALSQYLVPLRRDAHPSDNTIRINFNGWKVDTGRFAAPADKNPAENGGTSFPMHGTPATYDKSRPECLRRIRECIIARPGRLLCAIDYSGVELRLVTNLSLEPKWLKEYFRCSSCDYKFDTGDGKSTPEAPPPFCPRCGSDKIGDLHTASGIAFYGADSPNKPGWKQKRQNAKGANFALCYGGSGRAVQRSIGCDENEGFRIARQFNATYKGLQVWWERTRKYARKHGFVITAFGRRYPVPDILKPKFEKTPDGETLNNGSFIAKAERNAVNGPIQGSSADITKLAMALCHRECKKRGWLDKVYMTITIHDELVFEITTDIIAEALPILMNLMARPSPVIKLRWPVPLTLDCEIGHDWTVPWNLVEFQHGKKPWPDALRPYFPDTVPAVAVAEGDPADAGEGASGGDPEVTGKGGTFSGGAQAPPSLDEMDQGKHEMPIRGKSSVVHPKANVDLAPDLAKGEPFVFTLSAPLSHKTARNLAEIIGASRIGSHPLQIVTQSGETVPIPSPITVNPTEFTILARHRGI